MILTATQVRRARELLGWTTPRIARNARISFAEALRAQDDEGVRTLDGLQLRAIQEAFERGGVEFRSDGAVRLHRDEK